MGKDEWELVVGASTGKNGGYDEYGSWPYMREDETWRSLWTSHEFFLFFLQRP